MTHANAKADAQKTANESGLEIAVVNERYHADEFAEYDADGYSYGYCPVDAVEILYSRGVVIETLKPAA